MDPVVSVDTGSVKGLEELVTLLNGPGVAASERDAVLTQLVSNLHSGNEAVMSKSCECLRMFLRGTEASRFLYTEANIRALVDVTNLPTFAAHEALSCEAIKCLVNFAIRAMEIERANGNEASDSLVLRVMRSSGWGPLAFRTLETAVTQSKESDTTFALCRLLNMIVWDEEMRDSVSNQRLVDVLLALFGHHIALLEGPSVPEKDQIRFNIAGDSVRMMFQLTTEYGPLSSRNAKAARAYPMTSESKKLEDQIMSESPVPEHIQFLFKNSVELLKRALLLDFHDPNRRQLQLSCMSYALNLPKEQILTFDAYKVLPYLIEISKFHLEMDPVDASAATSILMLFTKIVRDEPQTRALFMTAMFPRWKEVFETANDPVKMPPQHRGTIGHRIIDCMQSVNTGLQFYANEFVFLLCNENAGAFTRFVGFGPAAGHLAMRGLMNIGGNAEGSSRASEGGEERIGGTGQGRATNWKETSIPEPDFAHMSAEDLKEWNELMDKMERLDKLGVIKMMKPKDDESK